MVDPGTYKADALVTLWEHDVPLTSSEVKKKGDTGDVTQQLRELYDDGYVERDGVGKRGSPYEYTLTGKGEAAARDLANGDEDPPEDAGLGALFDDPENDVDEPDEDTEVEPDAADHLVDAKVDATEERIADVERYVDGVDDRLRRLEESLSGADNVVAISDDDLVDAVYLIANADCAGASYGKKTELIAGLIGADESGPTTIFDRLNAVLTGDEADVERVEDLVEGDADE